MLARTMLLLWAPLLATSATAHAAQPWVSYAQTSFYVARNSFAYEPSTEDIAFSKTLAVNITCTRGWDFATMRPAESVGRLSIFAADARDETTDHAVFWSLGYDDYTFDCRKLIADGPHSRRLQIVVPALVSFEDVAAQVSYAGKRTRLRVNLRFTRVPVPDISGPRRDNGLDFQLEGWEAYFPSRSVDVTGSLALEGGPNFYFAPDELDRASWFEQRGRVADPRYCEPQTCAEALAECGPAVGDDCGGTMDCGDPCVAPLVCDIYDHLCCQPEQCFEAQRECGPYENRCGTTTDCGLCDSNETCQPDGSCLVNP